MIIKYLCLSHRSEVDIEILHKTKPFLFQQDSSMLSKRAPFDEPEEGEAHIWHGAADVHARRNHGMPVYQGTSN